MYGRSTLLHVGASCRIAMLITTLLLLGGCAQKAPFSSEYGKRVGRIGGASVNGTSVFGRMFREGGARVKTATRLGREIERSDVVVWAPDRFAAPSVESRQYFENWLVPNGSKRTLIYVGRDYDAAVRYFETLAEQTYEADPQQFLQVRKKLAEEKVREASLRLVYDEEEDCDWFSLDRSNRPVVIKSLAGPLSDGVDGSKVDITLQTRVKPSSIVKTNGYSHLGKPEFKPLLQSGKEVLVGRFRRENWGENQILIVANGSWVLNLPLVNHEHRRLAGNLIAECGNVDKVVFLESGPGSPPISNQEANKHHGLTAFTVWPMNCILLHLLALGVVFCFTLFPIFGRPRELTEPGNSDFGKHITAIGELMARTHDRHYAQRCLEQYQSGVADSPATTSNESSLKENVLE